MPPTVRRLPLSAPVFARALNAVLPAAHSERMATPYSRACGDDILGECLEPNAVSLHDGNRDLTRLTGLDVSDNARLPRMRTGSHLALRAILQFSLCLHELVSRREPNP